MQAGYRTKPSARAKDLKARVKNSKLDNAVYGSDFKAEAQLNAISDGPDTVKVIAPSNTSSGVSWALKKTQAQASPLGVDLTNLVYPSRSASVVGSPMSVRTSSTLNPVAPPSSTISGTPAVGKTINIMDELRSKLMQVNLGLRPRDTTQITKSDVGQITRSGPLGNLAAEFERIKGNADSVKQSTVKTTTKTASNAPNTQSQVQTDTVVASTAPAAAPTDSKSELKATKSNLAEVMSKTDSDLSQTITDPSSSSSTGSLQLEVKPDGYTIDMSPRNDKVLQRLGDKLYAAVQKFNRENGKRESQNRVKLTLYKWDENVNPETPPISTFMHKQTDSAWRFNRIKGKHTVSSEIKNQEQYDLRSTVREALKKINDGDIQLTHTAQGNIEGLGLESSSARVVWKNQRPKKYDGTYDRFVLTPAFMNGHVRLYGTGDRSALVSQSNASPSFLRLVKDVVNNGTFDPKDYNTVDPKESPTVNMFIKSTKPIIPSGVEFNASHAGDIYELRKRYQVLVGSLAAGNHGTAVKDEMIDILRKLQRLKVMSVARVRNLIKGLNEL